MRLMLNAVNEGRADCAVSAGNAGALVAISRFVLKTMPGVDRPALTAIIPWAQGFMPLCQMSNAVVQTCAVCPHGYSLYFGF